MGKQYRFKLFNLGFITGLFKREELERAIGEGTEGGFRLVRREFTLEPRRVLMFLGAPSFGLMFEKPEDLYKAFEFSTAEKNVIKSRMKLFYTNRKEYNGETGKDI